MSWSSIRRVGLALFLAWLALLGSCAGSGDAMPDNDILAARIDAYLAQAPFAQASWGIQVVSLKTLQPVYARNARRSMVPASNAKLFSAAMALDAWSPDFRFVTPLHASTAMDGQAVLSGDLVWYGRGDPTLGATASTGALQDPLPQLAAALWNLGLREIRGDVVIDDTFFTGPAIVPSWEAGDLGWSYAPPVSATTWAENLALLTVRAGTAAGAAVEAGLQPEQAIQLLNQAWTVPAGEAVSLELYRDPQTARFHLWGGLPVGASDTFRLALDDPAAQLGRQWQAALTNQGIRIPGTVRVRRWPEQPVPSVPGGVALVQLPSPTLQEILGQTLKRSQNLYAQTLWLQAGARAAQQEGAVCEQDGQACDTHQWAAQALASFVQKLDIAPQSVALKDGNGLSRQNIVTAEAIVSLLQSMSLHPAAPIFIDALPIAGQDGTLINRMKNTRAQGNLRAKTGTLSKAAALSGYVTTAAGEPLAFSILLNHYNPAPAAEGAAPPPSAAQAIDAIAVMLADDATVRAGH